jgi:hypothetical protein
MALALRLVYDGFFFFTREFFFMRSPVQAVS